VRNNGAEGASDDYIALFRRMWARIFNKSEFANWDTAYVKYARRNDVKKLIKRR